MYCKYIISNTLTYFVFQIKLQHLYFVFEILLNCVLYFTNYCQSTKYIIRPFCVRAVYIMWQWDALLVIISRLAVRENLYNSSCTLQFYLKYKIYQCILNNIGRSDLLPVLIFSWPHCGWQFISMRVLIMLLL